MFPLSHRQKITIQTDNIHQIDTHKIINIFAKQFDNPNFITKDTISFDNFNVVLKRHNWLSDGTLKISTEDNQIFADLKLNFSYFLPSIMLIGSVIIIVKNINNIWFGLFLVFALWSIYSLFYQWTIGMFNSTIKRTINHQLFLAQTKINDDKETMIVKDVCPACNCKLKTSDMICPDCGIVFTNE